MSSTLAGKVGGPVKAITDAGYNLDFFDDQLLAMRGKVSGDTLAFGDVRYRAVVLPECRAHPARHDEKARTICARLAASSSLRDACRIWRRAT